MNRRHYRNRANRLANIMSEGQRRILRAADVAADDDLLFRRVLLPVVVREARRVANAREELARVNEERRLSGAFAANLIREEQHGERVA